ncbi:unnamed protein product [Closterium sp. Naga37s-1]|nr:unnamed protein product [Closterium sp. Naga37s-1]
MVALGCAVGAFRGCKATLTVLRGTSKFIIAVDISPSALVQETASQITEAEAALPGFQSASGSFVSLRFIHFSRRDYSGREP